MNKRLRAVLLAAGLGTRLRPITLSTPKCLVDVAGQPLLEHWLNKLEIAGCEAVLINTHYLAEQVEVFVQRRRKSDMMIEIVYEPKLLGTAGTLIANKDFFDGATGLLIHADNVMAEDLNGFLDAHESRADDCMLSMLTFNTDTPESCGIVKTDEQGVIREFHEKIDNPPGNIANGALYAFDKVFVEHVAGMKPSPTDFSTDVIPLMMGMIQTWHTSAPYLDIGTPSALSRAQVLIKEKA